MDKKTATVYEETFYIIPRYIRKLPGITLGYLDVFETIFQFWNKNLPCFLSSPAIAERTGLGESQVYEALNFFEKHKVLERIKKGGKRYLRQPVREIETDCLIDDNSNNGSNIVPKSGQSDSQSPAHRTHNIKNRNKEDLYKKEKIYKKEKVDYEYSETLYPIPIQEEKKELAKISPKLTLSLDDMLGCNPFSIPEQSLLDWIEVRKKKKAPITLTAWDVLHKELRKFKEAGHDVTEKFNMMVANGWASIKYSWVPSSKSNVESNNYYGEPTKGFLKGLKETPWDKEPIHGF